MNSDDLLRRKEFINEKAIDIEKSRKVIRTIEIIFEAIPQYILQGYISFMKRSNSKYKAEVITDSFVFWLRLLSLLKSFISVALGF